MKHRIETILVTISISTILILSGYNCIVDFKDFFKFSVSSTISLIIAIVFAFLFVQKNQDNRRFYDSMIKILESIQNIINNKFITTNFNDNNINNLKQEMRIVRNKIDQLKKVANKLHIDEEVKHIEDKFNEYRSFIDNHYNDYVYLNKSSPDLNNFITLMDSKITEVIIKIYSINL